MSNHGLFVGVSALSGFPFAGHVKAWGVGSEKPSGSMCKSDLHITDYSSLLL
jgi:hypothetical protein